MNNKVLTPLKSWTKLYASALNTLIYSIAFLQKLYGVAYKNLYGKPSKNVHSLVQIVNKLYAKRPKTYTPKTLLNTLFTNALSTIKHPFEPVR